jgi:two-component system response regulator YesN
MPDLGLILANIALPLCAGMTFFALAKYASHVAPMRFLVTGNITYKGAAWGFAFFGAYLMTRPLEVLLGPHPMPSIITCIREFGMMALFAPAVFLAMMSLCFGSENIPRKLIVGIFALGFFLGSAYVVLETRAIHGSEVIFRIGNIPAYDGIWFGNPDPHSQALISIIYVLQFIDPVFILLLSGVIVFRHARHYPEAKRLVYDNMPKKLLILSAAVFAFPFSMLIAGALIVFFHGRFQWWLYYLGALVSGLIEAASLRLPLRKDVQVSEHDR